MIWLISFPFLAKKWQLVLWFPYRECSSNKVFLITNNPVICKLGTGHIFSFFITSYPSNHLLWDKLTVKLTSTELALAMCGRYSAYKGVQLLEKGATIYIDFIPLTKLQGKGGVNDLKQFVADTKVCHGLRRMPPSTMELSYCWEQL